MISSRCDTVGGDDARPACDSRRACRNRTARPSARIRSSSQGAFEHDLEALAPDAAKAPLGIDQVRGIERAIHRAGCRREEVDDGVKLRMPHRRSTVCTRPLFAASSAGCAAISGSFCETGRPESRSGMVVEHAIRDGMVSQLKPREVAG